MYRKRRWVAADVATKLGGDAGRPSEPPQFVSCPACARIAEHMPSGYLLLDGDFVAAHRDEITALITAEAARAAEDNPTGRILAWERDPRHAIVVSTTTEHLAQRLGHALQKAYDGDVTFDFSHENKFARVYWRRDGAVADETPVTRRRRRPR